MSEFRFQHAGGCRCGLVRYSFHCNQPAAELQPRACQCLFCKPRGAAYLGSGEGRLEVQVTDKRYLYAHAFGTRTADFIHCGRCNELVYVTSMIDGRIYALVELHSLEAEIDPDKAVPMDFGGESLEERLARRAGSWIPELEVTEHA